MELDSMKKAWKEQKTASFSHEQILAMLKKKSSSIAKWIFYISLGELLLGIILNFVLPSYDASSEKLPAIVVDYLDVVLYVNYLFILIFIFLFFRNYKNIEAKSNISSLLQNILKTRRTVNYYILYNLVFFGISLVLTFYWIFSDKTHAYIPENIKGNTRFIAIAIAITLFISTITIGAMYLFYRVLYGFLLGRLKKNYKEIKQLQ